MNIASDKAAGFSKLIPAGAFAPNTGAGNSGGGSKESSTGTLLANYDKGVDENAASEDQTRRERKSRVMSIPEEDEDDLREGSGGDAGGKDNDVVNVVEAAPEEESTEGETEPEEVLVKATLCPPLHNDLNNVAFKLFDEDESGTVTREVRNVVFAIFLFFCLLFIVFFCVHRNTFPNKRDQDRAAKLHAVF